MSPPWAAKACAFAALAASAERRAPAARPWCLRRHFVCSEAGHHRRQASKRVRGRSSRVERHLRLPVAAGHRKRRGLHPSERARITRLRQCYSRSWSLHSTPDDACGSGSGKVIVISPGQRGQPRNCPAQLPLGDGTKATPKIAFSSVALLGDCPQTLVDRGESVDHARELRCDRE